MRIIVTGAGAMGSVFGGKLARAGCDITLHDIDARQIGAIAATGVKVTDPDGTVTQRVKTVTDAAPLREFDLALMMVAGDLTVSVEIEDRRPGAVKRIEASTETDTRGDFESQIESTLRRGRRVWPRIEEDASEARVVDEIVCGRRGIHVIMVHGVWLRPGAARRSVRAI